MGSSSSISFATVTPSLVTAGAPNFFSRTTLRPLGPSVTLTAPDNCDYTGCNITVTASQGTHPLSGGSYTASPAGTISVSIGGTVVKTFAIDQTDVYSASFTYTPTSSGEETVSATVVDSVLYSGSDSKSVNFISTPPATPLTNPSANYSPGTHKLTITWSGGTGTVTVTRNGVVVCSAPASDGQCSSTNPTYGITPPARKVVLTDSTGTSVSTTY